MVDFMTLTRLAKGKLAADVLGNIVDPTRIWYYGISQGHILGSTFFAYDQTLTRAVLGVGGANWAVMFERSKNWAAYSLPLKGAYGGVMNSIILQQVIEMGLELVDGGTIAPQIRAGGLPGAAPSKRYLQQMSVGDCSVPNLASEYQARTMGIPVLTPSPYVPQGMQASSTPVPNGMVIYDFGVGSTIPLTNEPPPDNDVHSNIRNKRATIEMMRKFYSEGVIEQLCTSPSAGCDCTASACGEQI
jgi:hypothetical protein